MDEPTLAELEVEFLEASIAVWRSVDLLTSEGASYPGIPTDDGLRIRERKAWEAYRDAMDLPTDPDRAEALIRILEEEDGGVDGEEVHPWAT